MKGVILMATLVAGCATMPPPDAPVGPCRIDEAVRMRFAAVEFRAGMRDELQRRTGARVVRVLRPGDAATMDFREDRLTIEVDDDRQIAGLRCG